MNMPLLKNFTLSIIFIFRKVVIIPTIMCTFYHVNDDILIHEIKTSFFKNSFTDRAQFTKFCPTQSQFC